MANPNILNVTAIYGKTAGLAVTTAATDIVDNAAASGKIFKVNSLTVANINTTAATVTVDVYKNQTTAFEIAHVITVPANATLVIISRETPIYLEENDSIRLTASVNSYLEGVVSYEEISS
jgi:hypothetical protein